MSRPLQRSFLLRLWREHAEAPMRATLIPVEQPDKPQHFANLDQLFARLSTQVGQLTPGIEGLQWDSDYCTPDDPC